MCTFKIYFMISEGKKPNELKTDSYDLMILIYGDISSQHATAWEQQSIVFICYCKLPHRGACGTASTAKESKLVQE